MKFKLLPLLGAFFISAAPAQSPQSAADLLDEAIWWPGDFGQICRGDSDWSFEEPPLTYGTLGALDYFLSEKRIAQLKDRRADIVPELVKRLKAFHWQQPPAPRPVRKDIPVVIAKTLAAEDPNSPGPAPWKPMNPDALNTLMLRIIEELDADEALPELLRLEGELDSIQQANLKAATEGIWNKSKQAPPVPGKIETSQANGWGRWTRFDRGEGEDWAAWRSQTFDIAIFQREILGVALGIIHRKRFPLLDQSMIGRLAMQAARRSGRESMEIHGLKSAADLAAHDSASYLTWDKALDQAMPKHMTEELPGTSQMLAEARLIIHAFIHRESPGHEAKGPVITTDGAALLRETLASPGHWSQMCSYPPAISADVPMPAMTQLASRYFDLFSKPKLRLQAHRDLVMPALMERVAKLKVEPPPASAEPIEWSRDMKSGQSPDIFGPLIFQAIEALAGIECLPDLLRLEQDLHTGIAKHEAQPKAVPPALLLDSPSSVKGDKGERAIALSSWRIYQRELLALIATLLEGEEYPPFEQSLLFKARTAANRKATDAALAKAKSRDDLPWQLERSAYFNEETKRWEMPDDIVLRAQVPFTPELRADLCRIAEQFLKEVPAKQRRAGDAMILEEP
jgi:hypothetical protein